MAERTVNEKLALEGGPQAVPGIEGVPKPKNGVEDFLAIAERFGFAPEAIERIRGVISDADLGAGVSLARYGSGRTHTSGEAFEEAVREVFGVPYVLPVSSGTGALHSAFVAAGVGPGTEVICPAVGFFATAAAVVQSKGIPIFCDVDESMTIDPAKIEALITPRTVAIAPTHVMGMVCDMDPIMAVARKHNLKVIEDCAQAPGARYKGRLVGTIGDIGCFSISCYKIIGGGEGGMLITHDQRLWERAAGLAECGGLWRQPRFAPPRYPGELFCGTNYRMSELEAAVNVNQIKKLNAVVERYHKVMMRVLSQLRRFREIVPQKLNDVAGEVGYTIRFYPETVELSQRIVQALVAEGISAWMYRPGSPDWHVYSDMFAIMDRTGATAEGCPYTCPYYAERGGHIEYTRSECPVADDLYRRDVMVSLGQWLTERDCDNIAHGINKVLAAYCTEDPAARGWLGE